MKEFDKRFNAEYLNGLTTSSNMPRGADKLSQCFNAIPTEYGLESYNPVINPLISAYTFDWPFPQIFIGKRKQILMDKDAVYSINFDWSLTLELDLSSYYTANPSWDYTIWHFADFYDYVVLTNENIVIIYNITTSLYEVHSATSIIPVFTTITNYNGQAVAGNITSPWYDTDENFVIWSKMGSMDFMPDEYNTSGYRPMPWYGEVLSILKLGNGVVVYGTGGILYMQPSDQYWNFTRLSEFGIAGRGAVMGDEFNHVFVDEAGILRKITASESIKKLGYQELFSSMLTNDIMVAHSSSENYFYIGDGTTSYVLTDQGLGEIDQAVTSVKFYSGGDIGITKNINSNDNYLVSSHIFDLNIRGIKVLTTIEFGVNTGDECFVSIDYRYDKTEDFISTNWIRLNKEGVAYIPAGGIDFRWNFKCSNYNNVNLDHVIVRFKVTDKRFIRGTYNVS